VTPGTLSVLLLTSALACSATRPLDSHGDASDASPDADAASVDVGSDDSDVVRSEPEPGYEAWWFPACTTPSGACPEDKCFRNQVEVAATLCGPFAELLVGCVPRDTVLAGWFCLIRSSNGQVIFTQVAPLSSDFERCVGVGNLPPVDGQLCPDAGGD
jgi:hypothetical protein